MKLKLTVEIVADNYEEMLKAIDEVKQNYYQGAIFFSSKNCEGYNYRGEVSDVKET